MQKNALNIIDHKRIQPFNRITTYPYGIDKELINKLEKEIKENPIQLYY